ncbi:unnamed protein product [Somion occarium]|uniref:GATA-type domain-containing protein n=1 Tax=Somion occarium TaxID=3059160 RepID=A0ABP1E7Y8_9APHY
MLSRPSSPKRASPRPDPPPKSPPPVAPHLLDPELDKPKQESITLIDASPPKPPQLQDPVPFSYSTSANPVENRWNPPPPPPLHLSFTPAVFAVPYELSMPHRVEPERHSSRRTDDRAFDHSQPSTPPITTIHHSPAVSVTSLAHSSISSPSPPVGHLAFVSPYPSFSYTQQLPPPSAQYYQHPSYSYTPPPPPPGRYADVPQGYSSVVSGAPVTTRAIRPAYVPTQSYPGQANYVIHTDDAATKLSDRVRRKCYNCRTTDTSTWRRSSLTPGKVLCNKCGLFERTHSRPRPEQFPHKRGPIVTTSFKSTRTPPPAQARLPPISQPVPPHQYDHPSIAPLMNRSDSQHSHSPNGSNGTSPELRNILNGPSGAPDHHANGSLSGPAENGHARTPPSRTPPHHSPRVEQRTPPQATSCRSFRSCPAFWEAEPRTLCFA